MAYPTGFLPMDRKKAKLRSEFLDYERTNNLAMQPAYPLTFDISLIVVTIFRYFGLQVARLMMGGTQISEYRVLYGFDPGFAKLVTRKFEWFQLMSGPPRLALCGARHFLLKHQCHGFHKDSI